MTSQAMGRGPWRRVPFTVVVATVLAVSVLTSAYSTRDVVQPDRRGAVATDLSSKCKSAREKFTAWLDSWGSADDADSKAGEQFTNIDPNLEPGEALTAAINQYNALAQTAQQLRATADQDLASAKKAIKRCRQSSMPKACRNEFRTYKPLLDYAATSEGLHATQSQAAAEAVQAQLSGNTAAFNDAVDRYNAENPRHNQLVDDYNNNLRPAYESAHTKCKKAA